MEMTDRNAALLQCKDEGMIIVVDQGCPCRSIQSLPNNIHYKVHKVAKKPPKVYYHPFE